jgi:hypothetical protein
MMLPEAAEVVRAEVEKVPSTEGENSKFSRTGAAPVAISSKALEN